MINAAVTATVTNAVNNAIGNLQLPQGPQGATGPQGPQGEAGTSTSSDTSKWNAAEIGYFDPHLDKSYARQIVLSDESASEDDLLNLIIFGLS